jgi:hypothetical protein
MLLSIITPGFLFLYFSPSSSIFRSYYFPINTTLFSHLSVSILVRADANSSDSCRATERRYVFAIGNFIEFELDRIGRIDAIFVHGLTRERRLFVKNLKITEAHTADYTTCHPAKIGFITTKLLDHGPCRVITTTLDYFSISFGYRSFSRLLF